jgi:hypothetical protein
MIVFISLPEQFWNYTAGFLSSYFDKIGYRELYCYVLDNEYNKHGYWSAY